MSIISDYYFVFLRISILQYLWLWVEAKEPLIAPKVGDSWVLLQAALAARNKELGGGRDHIRNGLGSEDITARFQPGSEASCECLEQEGVCAQQILTGCCLVLKNRSVTRSAASARLLLSGSDTFETQLLFVMLRVKGCLRAALLFPLFQLPTSSSPHCSLKKAFPLLMHSIALAGPLWMYVQNWVLHP